MVRFLTLILTEWGEIGVFRYKSAYSVVVSSKIVIEIGAFYYYGFYVDFYTLNPCVGIYIILKNQIHLSAIAFLHLIVLTDD